MELGDLAFAAPAAQSRRAGGELTRPVPFGVDRGAFRDEAEQHIGGAREGQKQLLGRGPASRAVETVVITARLSGALATRLVQRSLAAQGISIVWVDSASFAGRPTKVEPDLLRLQAAGVAVAVVRRGDSLAAVLGAAPAVRSAHG